MSEQIIDAYIEYLRNISRKIISNSGFEDVLPEITKKRNHFYFNFEEYKSELIINKLFIVDYEKQRRLHRIIKSIYEYLDNDFDYKLFLGSGLIVGYIPNSKKKQFVCAPLSYCPLDLEFQNRRFNIDIDCDSIQINHDLITRIFEIVIDEEADEEFGDQNDIISKFNELEIIENNYANEYDKILIDSTKFMNDLRNNVHDFKAIDDSETIFELKNKYEKDDNYFNGLKFFPHTFLFVNRAPHELSTYEAINTVLKSKPIENKLLKKLFQNILTDSKVELELDGENKENEIIEYVNKFIPLTLSDYQKTAIKKAWTSELSYIQGPPGTGKSYTISAILLSALFLKKKVLLVSHKEAAVNIVKNMVDDLLGKEAVLYIGMDTKSKKITKEYLDNLIHVAEKQNNTLFSEVTYLDKLLIEIKDYEKEIERLYANYKNIHNKISDNINNENDFYNKHNEFVKRRDLFFKTYKINDITKYEWKKKTFNENKYKKAINKFEALINKKEVNRIDILYKSKFINHFVKEFDCKKDIIFKNHIYADEIFSLNCTFSKINALLKRFDRKALSNLKKDLNHLEDKYRLTLKEYLPKYWKYMLLYKLSGEENKHKREEVDAFKRMLKYTNAKIIKVRMENIKYDKLLEIFPFWCSELRDLGKMIALRNEIFDLVIVDEASQVNISEIIPAFYRGTRFCVVGDKNQLNLNATGVGFAVSKTFDKLSWKSVMVKYDNVITYEHAKERNLIVTNSSILDFVSSETNDFTIPTIMLDEHFRSLPPLALFTNKSFYEEKLKIMTENGENMKKDCFKDIQVNGFRDINRKIVQAEIDSIEEVILKKLKYNVELPELEPFKKYKGDEPFSFGILSFLTLQVQDIRKLIDDRYEYIKKKHNIFIATPEEFQGNERDVMLISFGLDSTCRWGKGFYENTNRFNVATSRAKYFTYVFHAGLPSNIQLIRKYFLNFGIDYSNKEKHDPIINNVNKWKFDLKNIESDFEHKVYNFLNNYKNKNNHIEIYNQVNACGQKRLDFVLFDSKSNITCAIEVDGKEHFIDGSSKYHEAHLSRMAILKRAGWKIINIKYYNWWDNGWLCDDDNPYFKEEIKRLYSELDSIFVLNTSS